MGSYLGTFGALLVSGLLGSVGHCLGMCGPLVMMVGVQLKRHERAMLPSFLLYHMARVMIYALLGAIIGGIGSLLGLADGLGRLAGIVSLVLGFGVILFGVGYLGWLPLGRLEGSGAWLNRMMSRALRQGGFLGVLGMGALNGLLPCGLVYSALLVAASTGGPLPGAVGMIVFGLGTIPALLVAGVGAGALSVRARQAMGRVAGILIMVIGLQLGLRGLAALGVVPHLHIRGVVIW
jgi:sulfite exporter TauE/SafE